MQLVKDRLVYPRGFVGENIYMFTANSVIKQDGKLVMGRGCAKSVRDTYFGIDKLFGDKIKRGEEFNLSFVKWGYQWIGAFQTKTDWRKPSPLPLIQNSINKLRRVAEERPTWTFHLPCPAVSHGGRCVDEILPMLECLPDNVIIYLDKRRS